MNFFKAYDKVNLDFLFTCMGKMGIPREFVSTTKILFNRAYAHININGKLSKAFAIQ